MTPTLSSRTRRAAATGSGRLRRCHLRHHPWIMETMTSLPYTASAAFGGTWSAGSHSGPGGRGGGLSGTGSPGTAGGAGNADGSGAVNGT